MSSKLERGARLLVAEPAGSVSSPAQLADRAVQACELLATHLATQLGATGVQLLWKRSIVRASAQHPWLAGSPAPADVLVGLRDAMATQDRDAITEAFVALLTAFVELLERLIGAGLVERLLEEVWPAVFVEPKDTQ